MLDEDIKLFNQHVVISHSPVVAAPSHFSAVADLKKSVDHDGLLKSLLSAHMLRCAML